MDRGLESLEKKQVRGAVSGQSYLVESCRLKTVDRSSPVQHQIFSYN